MSEAYRTQLARQINAALDAAEKHAATEGFALYPFVYGYLVGDLSEDEIAAFETETPGYDMLNATVAYDLRAGGDGVQLYARATNLLDELALNHTSFIKDAAPLRGRNVVFGVRARF